MEITHRITQQLSTIYPHGEAASIARWVMEDVFHLTLADLLLGKDSELSADDLQKLQIITERLLKKEPVQYVLGHTTFCGHTFHVAPGVLIPRPETEELVAWASYTLSQSAHTHPAILDIGTGSGCIAISLALAHPTATVTAWDVSEQSLQIAQDNSQCLQAGVQFRQVDVLQPHLPSHRWDLIISNPPYICQSEAQQMEAHVLEHEPHLALFVPDDSPLLFYRAIATYATCSLTHGGMLYFEINRCYGMPVCDMLRSLGFTDVELKKDLYGNDRMIRARWIEKE